MEVSDKKGLAANGAFETRVAAATAALAAAGALGASWTIFGAVAATTLLGLAASLYAKAADFYSKAMDPPEPNLRYREPVQINPRALPTILTQIGSDNWLVPLLETTGRILAEDDALGETYNRMLGARQANDISSLQLQINEYLKIEGLLAEDLAKLPNVVAQFEQGLKTTIIQPRQQLELLLMLQSQGLPEGLREQALVAGISKDILSELEMTIRDPSIIEQISRGDLAEQIDLLVKTIHAFGQAVQLEAQKTLKQEERSM